MGLDHRLSDFWSSEGSDNPATLRICTYLTLKWGSTCPNAVLPVCNYHLLLPRTWPYRPGWYNLYSLNYLPLPSWPILCHDMWWCVVCSPCHPSLGNFWIPSRLLSFCWDYLSSHFHRKLKTSWSPKYFLNSSMLSISPATALVLATVTSCQDCCSTLLTDLTSSPMAPFHPFTLDPE